MLDLVEHPLVQARVAVLFRAEEFGPGWYIRKRGGRWAVLQRTDTLQVVAAVGFPEAVRLLGLWQHGLRKGEAMRPGFAHDLLRRGWSPSAAQSWKEHE
jgi:hypothetical protein